MVLSDRPHKSLYVVLLEILIDVRSVDPPHTHSVMKRSTRPTTLKCLCSKYNLERSHLEPHIAGLTKALYFKFETGRAFTEGAEGHSVGQEGCSLYPGTPCY